MDKSLALRSSELHRPYELPTLFWWECLGKEGAVLAAYFLAAVRVDRPWYTNNKNKQLER